MLNDAKLRRTLDRLGGLTIAVVGDLFLDRYLDIDGRLSEKSIETGLDAYQVIRVRSSPGAGGTVLNNLAALGVGRLLAVSIIGCDGEGFELKRALAERGVALELLVESPERVTPTYTKPMLDDGTGPAHELNRLDIRNRTPTPAHLESAICAHLQQVFSLADAVVVADQVEEANWGVVTATVRERLAELASRDPDKVVLADSRAHIGLFRNVRLKPNLAECLRAVAAPVGKVGQGRVPGQEAARLLSKGGRAGAGGQSAPPPTNGGQGGVPIAEGDQGGLDTARRCSDQLARRAGGAVYCTLGSKGILYTDGNDFEHVPGYAVEGPIDIVGAGDATTAGIVCGLCTGMSAAEAAALGNLVASIAIRQLGTTGTATPEQVLARWAEVNDAGG